MKNEKGMFNAMAKEERAHCVLRPFSHIRMLARIPSHDQGSSL